MALLLDIDYKPDTVTAVEKASTFLASKWFEAEGSLKDKWVRFANPVI